MVKWRLNCGTREILLYDFLRKMDCLLNKCTMVYNPRITFNGLPSIDCSRNGLNRLIYYIHYVGMETLCVKTVYN